MIIGRKEIDTKNVDVGNIAPRMSWCDQCLGLLPNHIICKYRGR